jgi:hypothetical protein
MPRGYSTGKELYMNCCNVGYNRYMSSDIIMLSKCLHCGWIVGLRDSNHTVEVIYYLYPSRSSLMRSVIERLFKRKENVHASL